MSKLSAKVMAGIVIAFVACSPKPPPPGTNRNQANSTAEEKFGLSEAKRKQISEEIFQLWAQASYESNKKYPFIVPGEKIDLEKMKGRGRKRAKLEHSLMKNYINELTKNYGLSLEQLKEIQQQGIDKEWTEYPTLPPVHK